MKNVNVKFGTFICRYICVYRHMHTYKIIGMYISFQIQRWVLKILDFNILKLIKVINSFIIYLFKNARYFKHSKTFIKKSKIDY